MAEQFNEQQFLMDFIHLFKNERKADNQPCLLKEQYNPVRVPVDYEHIMIVDGNPDTALNQMAARNKINLMDDFTPEMMSLLVPHIQIFKVVKFQNKVEELLFPINQPTTENSILESVEQRGIDVSLQSIDWRDTGKDTSYAGVTLQGTMKFTFQSFEGFFMDRETRLTKLGGPNISFADLTTNAPSIGTRESLIKDAEDPFPVKIVVGWAVPTDPNKSIFTIKDLEKIRRMQTVLNVATNKSDLSLRPNGQLDVSMTFTGRFETAMVKTKYDLFWTDPVNNDNAMRRMRIRQANKQLKEQKEISQKLQSKDRIKQEGDDAALEKSQKVETEIKDHIFYIQQESLRDAWSKLLEIINQSIIKSGTENERRIFKAQISKEFAKKYIKLRELSRETNQLKREIGEESEGVIEDFRKNRDASLKDIAANIFVPWDGDVSAEEGAINALSSELKEAKGTEGSAAERYKKAIEAGAKNFSSKRDFSTGDFPSVTFFFLGDLINAALKIIHDRPETKGSTIDGADGCGDRVSAGKKNPNRKQMYDEARIMLGSIMLEHPVTGEKFYINLADIPISLNAFKEFWYKKVFAARLSSYPLRSFLGDLCSNFVKNFLDRSFYGTRSTRTRNVIQINTLPFNKNGSMDRMWGGASAVDESTGGLWNTRTGPQPTAKGGKQASRKRIHIDELMGIEKTAAAKDTDGKSEQTGTPGSSVEYLYLYSRGSAPSNPHKLLPDTDAGKKSDLEWHREMGIPHLFVGNNIGPVKQLNFKRTPIPNRLEHSILQNVKNGGGARSQFLLSDRYDADIDLFGNPVYKPGLKIYVDPRSLGLGRSAAADFKKKTQALDLKTLTSSPPGSGYNFVQSQGTDWAIDLGLGGYYVVVGVNNSISAGHYETKLTAISEVGLGLQRRPSEGKRLSGASATTKKQPKVGPKNKTNTGCSLADLLENRN